MIYEESSTNKENISSKINILKILSLKVSNFMSFRDTREFIFDNQIALIQGINGSGKSSILEALLVSIDSSARASKIEEVVHKEDGCPAKFAEITLTLATTIGNLEIYTKISSNIEENKKNRRIEKRVVVGNNVYVNKQAQDLFDKMNLSQIARVCFVLQNDPGLISRHGLDNYKSLISLFNINFDDEVDSVFADIKKMSLDYHDTEAAVNSAKGQQETYSSIISSKESQLLSDKDSLSKDQNILNSNASLKDFDEEIEDINSKLNDIKIKIQAINSNAAANKKYSKMILDADAKISAIDSQIKLRDEKNNALQQVMAAMRSLDEMSSLLKKFEDIQKSTEDSLHDAEINLASLSAEEKQERNRFALIANGYCPTCKSKIDKNKISELNSTIDTIASNIKETKASISQLTTRLAKSKEGVDKFKNDINSRQSLEKEIKTNAELNESDSTKINEQQSIKSELSALIKDVDDSSLNSLLKESDELNVSLQEAKSKKQAFEEALQKRKDIQALSDTINDYKSQLAIAKSKVSDGESKLNDISSKINVAEQAKTIFKDVIPLNALKSMCLALESCMTKVIAPVGYGQVKITTDDRYVDFLLEEKKSKEMLPIYLCSTFEQNLLQVSAKLAIVLLKGYRFLCLDEVDGCATNENASLLVSTIIKFAEKHGIQILIISHESSTKSLIASLSNSSIISL